MSLTKSSFSMTTNAPVNVQDFGADPTGVNLCNAAFDAALAVSGTLYLGRGTYRLENWTAVRCRLIGEKCSGDGSQTVIQGSGNLLVNAEYVELENLQLKNVGTRGKLISIVNSDVGMGPFTNVFFNTAEYHIYQTGSTVVDFHLENCRFSDASVYSRYYNGAVNAYRENDCYTKENERGLYIKDLAVARISGVFEYNNSQAITIESSNYCIGLDLTDLYFEGNGSVTPIADVKLYGNGTYINAIVNNVYVTLGSATPNFNLVGFNNIKTNNLFGVTFSSPSDSFRTDAQAGPFTTFTTQAEVINGSAPVSFDLDTLADGAYNVYAEMWVGGAGLNTQYSAIWFFQKRTGQTSSLRDVLTQNAPGNNNGAISVSGTTVSVSWAGSRSGRIVTQKLF